MAIEGFQKFDFASHSIIEKIPVHDKIVNYSLTQYLTITIIILLGFYLIKKSQKHWNNYKKMKTLAKEFDGPPTIPILGNAWSLAKDIRNLMYVLTEICEKYPTSYRMWLGPQLIIVINTLKDLEIIYNSSKASTKAFAYDFMDPISINGLINGKGPRFRAHKNHIIPYINDKQLLNHYIQAFNHHTKKCAEHLGKKVKISEFDILNALEPHSVDMIYETVFGIPGTTHIDGNLEFPHAMEKMLDLLIERIVCPWLHPSFLMNLSDAGRRRRKNEQIIFPFLEKIISDKRKIYEALERGEKTLEKPQISVLDFVVEDAVKTGTWTDTEIREDMVSMYYGSHDTLLIIVAWTILMFAMHPEIQDKVRAEVLAVVGDGDVTEDHITEMKYTEMALRETIRLYGAGPVTARAITDDLEIDNHTLPKGTTVVLPTGAIHRSPRFWVEPEKYNPDRHSPENSKNRHPYAFVPFSAGYRACLGFKFGLVCLKVWMVHLVRNFEFRTTMKMENVKLQANISTRSRDGYRVSMRKLSH